jgi:hypothetical protein
MNRPRRKKSNYDFPCGILNDLKSTEIFVPDLLTNFNREPIEIDGVECYALTSDISTLLRIDSIGSEATREQLIKVFDKMSKVSSNFDAITDKLTSTQLISLVKSRYLQSLSEVQAWASYLASNYKSIEIQDLMDTMQEEAAIIEKSETSKS